MPVVTAIDVLGVQGYVFASNRLRDVVAASWLVHRATARDGALREWGDRVLVAAGANALLEFDGLDDARRFTRQYTRRLIDEAPGLEAVVAHREHPADGLAAALEALQADVARAKLDRTPSAEQLGLSVTASCETTGLPATGVDSLTGRPAAARVVRWREVRAPSGERWQSLLGEDRGRLVFPDDLDHLGRSRGDTSLLGVVHVDGNGIGEKIAGWLGAHRGPDSQVRQQYREWSEALDDLVQGTLRAVVDRVRSAVAGEEMRGAVPWLNFGLHRPAGDVLALPLRPVLAGGDDLTFVCDGRIALDLAARALHAFESADIPHLGRVSACAGVALVPAHHPFARAYQTAENLCQHAKARRRERQDDGSWIDWHLGPVRPGEPIAALRSRTLRLRHGEVDLEFTCRPYRLGTGPDDVETWRWLSEGVLGTDAPGFRGAAWRERRNKVNALASAAREGPDPVKHLLDTWTVVDPGLALPGGLDDTGYLYGRRTPLLDAGEMLDLHLPLDPPAAATLSREVTT